MVTHLLDTDICIALLRGVPGTIAKVSSCSPDELAVSSVTRYELRFGAMRCAEKHRERELAKVHRLIETLHEIAFDAEAADRAAGIRTELGNAGTPIGPMDLQIAATAMANDLILATGNRKEFERVKGLRLAVWK